MCMHTHLHLCSDLTYHMRDVIYAMIWTHIYIYIYIYIYVAHFGVEREMHIMC